MVTVSFVVFVFQLYMIALMIIYIEYRDGKFTSIFTYDIFKITRRRAETRALILGGIHIFARRNSYEINPNNN